MPQEITFRLAEHQGLDARVLKPLRGMYASLHRRFVMAGHVGEHFSSTNGIIQGCPISVLLLNLLMNVWSRASMAASSSVVPQVFADDAGVISTTAAGIASVLHLTGSFAKVTQQKLNVGKSKAWCTAESSQQQLSNLSIGDESLEVVKSSRVLGVQISVRRNCKNIVARERLQKGIEIAKRIRWAPLPLHARANLIACMVGPVALYAFAAGGFPRSLVNSLQVAVTSALWGHKRRARCKEIVLTLFAKGHLVDPVQIAGYQCLLQMRRLMQNDPASFEQVVQLWQLYNAGQAKRLGPVAVLCEQLQTMGWLWKEPAVFERPGRPDIHLAQGPDSWWTHEVRQGMRQAAWRLAEQRRPDMWGIGSLAGIDREATLAVLNGSKNDAGEKNLLRELLCGCLWTQKRQHDHGSADSSNCRFCDHDVEDEGHILWQCPRWEHIRLRMPVLMPSVRAEWPPCTRACGLFVEDEALMQWCDLGPSNDPQHLANVSLPDHVGEHCASEQHDDGRLVVWTDGACVYNQDNRFRRAGCGVFFSKGNARNLAFTLPGREQTNNRAELTAALAAVRSHAGPVEVRSDSQYVVSQAAQLLRGEKVHPKANVDLWKEMEQEIGARQSSDLVFTWVKAHTTLRDVEKGRTTAQNKCGNDAADALASAAAQQHEAPAGLMAAAQRRKRHAVAFHSLACAILKQRAEDLEKLVEVVPGVHRNPSVADPG